MNERKCVIFGMSKIAEIVYQTILDDKESDYDVVAFCVDKQYKTCDRKFGLPVLEFEVVQEQYSPAEYDMLVAVGYHDLNRVRRLKCEEAKDKGYHLPGYINSKASIASNVKIGENTFVFENVDIGPFSQIGNDTFIFPGAIVSHHAFLGNHLWVTSGTVIGGNSKIEDYCFLGIHSSIGHNTRIGKMNFIGSGAVITKNTDDNEVRIIADTPKYRLDSDRFLQLFKFD